VMEKGEGKCDCENGGSSPLVCCALRGERHPWGRKRRFRDLGDFSIGRDVLAKKMELTKSQSSRGEKDEGGKALTTELMEPGKRSLSL